MLTFKRVNIGAIVLLAIILLRNFSLWYLLIGFLIWLTLTIIGSFHIRWNYFLTAKHKNNMYPQNAIALTFDDGPHAKHTPEVLALLKEFNAKATFFCIGKNAEQYPEIVQQIIADGHVIGNHSFAHTNNYGFLSTKKVIDDLNRNQQVISEITGLTTNFFRPPFGVTNPNISRAVKQVNLKIFGWSIRTYDTVANNPLKIVERVDSKITKGDVVLLHDTSETSVAVLEQLLKSMKQKKMNSITLGTLFNCKPYGV